MGSQHFDCPYLVDYTVDLTLDQHMKLSSSADNQMYCAALTLVDSVDADGALAGQILDTVEITAPEGESASATIAKSGTVNTMTLSSPDQMLKKGAYTIKYTMKLDSEAALLKLSGYTDAQKTNTVEDGKNTITITAPEGQMLPAGAYQLRVPADITGALSAAQSKNYPQYYSNTARLVKVDDYEPTEEKEWKSLVPTHEVPRKDGGYAVDANGDLLFHEGKPVIRWDVYFGWNFYDKTTFTDTLTGMELLVNGDYPFDIHSFNNMNQYKDSLTQWKISCKNDKKIPFERLSDLDIVDLVPRGQTPIGEATIHYSDKWPVNVEMVCSNNQKVTLVEGTHYQILKQHPAHDFGENGKYGFAVDLNMEAVAAVLAEKNATYFKNIDVTCYLNNETHNPGQNYRIKNEGWLNYTNMGVDLVENVGAHYDRGFATKKKETPSYGDYYDPTTYRNYVDGCTTMYVNIAPNEDVTNVLHNGGTVINKKDVVVSFQVQKVWSGLDEGETPPQITLVLYCNGEETDITMPNPDRNGWYRYCDLPEEVDGVKAVYTVKELAVDGYMTSYKLADGTDAEYADNGGIITNAKLPQTGDHAPLALWMAPMGASAAMLMLLLKRKRA